MSSMPAVVSAFCNEYDEVDCLLAVVVVVCCKSIRVFVVVVIVVAFNRCNNCFEEGWMHVYVSYECECLSIGFC